MSSSTDPYQPVEYKAMITRSLLRVMLDNPPDFLLVQTRSPLVRRDIDLLSRLGNNVRVSMTVETDREDIRKIFSPHAPPIPARLKALQDLADAGIPTQAAVAPVLPSSERFAETLPQIVNRICLDDYFMGDGSGGKRTHNLNIRDRYKEYGLEQWYDPLAIQFIYEQLNQYFSEHQLYISQKGFEP